MKNLKNYNENALTVYETALNKKRDDLLQNRLQPIYLNVSTAYDLYTQRFNLNQIESISMNAFFQNYKVDLLSLYRYSSYIIRKVKKTIDDIQPFFLSNTCQNCTINSVNSMDHILAQSNYPQYAVHPLNLFPSCTECNNYKSVSFSKQGYRRFLNLYSDKLPSEQYLFVNIFINDKGNLDWTFLIENRNHIEDNLFNLIKNHYEELNLYERMKISSIKYYSELRNTVNSRLHDLGWGTIVNQVKREITENMQNLGMNHYQYIFQLAMIESHLFQGSI